MSAEFDSGCTLTDVVAVRGGGITWDSGLSYSWIIEPETVEGRRLVALHVQAYRCKQYFSQQFAMVAHMKKLRNLKVAELMRALAQDFDPNESNPLLDVMPKRPKRELIDRLPKTITISVIGA